MNKPLRALVTGGNRGIGLEVVRQLALRGFEVVLGCRRLEDGASALGKLGVAGERITVLKLDVSDEFAVKQAAEEFGRSYSRLDVLVNNAAILLDAEAGILTVSEEALNNTWNTNTLGSLRVTRAFLPFLKKSEDPRVINVSSLAGQLKDMAGWAPAYSISKTALNAVTCLLAHELQRYAIKVNSVSPGWIRTDMGGPSAPGTVEEGSDTIVWLAADAPADLTGRFLRDREVTDW